MAAPEPPGRQARLFTAIEPVAAMADGVGLVLEQGEPTAGGIDAGISSAVINSEGTAWAVTAVDTFDGYYLDNWAASPNGVVVLGLRPQDSLEGWSVKWLDYLFGSLAVRATSSGSSGYQNVLHVSPPDGDTASRALILDMSTMDVHLRSASAWFGSWSVLTSVNLQVMPNPYTVLDLDVDYTFILRDATDGSVLDTYVVGSYVAAVKTVDTDLVVFATFGTEWVARILQVDGSSLSEVAQIPLGNTSDSLQYPIFSCWAGHIAVTFAAVPT